MNSNIRDVVISKLNYSVNDDLKVMTCCYEEV